MNRPAWLPPGPSTAPVGKLAPVKEWLPDNLYPPRIKIAISLFEIHSWFAFIWNWLVPDPPSGCIKEDQTADAELVPFNLNPADDCDWWITMCGNTP
jgi:hypothetical protein